MQNCKNNYSCKRSSLSETTLKQKIYIIIICIIKLVTPCNKHVLRWKCLIQEFGCKKIYRLIKCFFPYRNTWAIFVLIRGEGREVEQQKKSNLIKWIEKSIKCQIKQHHISL